jgi:hypothetical protein
MYVWKYLHPCEKREKLPPTKTQTFAACAQASLSQDLVCIVCVSLGLLLVCTPTIVYICLVCIVFVSLGLVLTCTPTINIIHLDLGHIYIQYTCAYNQRARARTHTHTHTHAHTHTDKPSFAWARASSCCLRCSMSLLACASLGESSCPENMEPTQE